MRRVEAHLKNMVTHGRQSKHLSDLGISTTLRSLPSNRWLRGVFHTQIVLVPFFIRAASHAARAGGTVERQGTVPPKCPSQKKIRRMLKEQWHHVHCSDRTSYERR